MPQLFYVTLMTLAIGMFAPYISIMVFDDLDKLRRFLPFYVTFMVGGLWLFYLVVALFRVLFLDLPFIW